MPPMRLPGFKWSFRWAAATLAVVAALAYAVLMPRSGGADKMWTLNSPDAAAVQVAARSLAATGRLTWEPEGGWPAEQSVPRSFSRTEDGWAPGSYVGLPAIYGALAAINGLAPLLWLTPLLGGLGVWLMFTLASRWRSEKVGLGAAALLAVTPAYWYASMQPFTPTIPFAVLLMASAVGFTSRHSSGWILGGLALGASLALRPHEAIWMLPAALFLLVRRASWGQIGLAAAGAAIPLAFAAWLQLATYGSILGAGYSLASAGDGGPFSLSLRVVAANVWRYLVVMHGFLLGLAAAGAALTLRGSAGSRRYLPAVLVVAAGLLLIYGSYLVHDSPGLAEPTIGNSQVRYMLPLLILLVPLAASLLARISAVASVGAIALAAFLSYGSVIVAPGDGTVAVQQTLTENSQLQATVLQSTDAQTLVIAGRLDKLFVGHRPTAFAATTGLVEQLRLGKRAAVVGGQGLPEGIKIGRRTDLPGGVVLQELLAE